MSSTLSSTNIERDRFGPPGIPGHLFILDVYKNETRSDEERLRDTSNREFQVNALLGRMESSSGIDLSVDTERGSSCISATPDAPKAIIHGPDGEITLMHNSRRELASAHFTVDATGSAEARRRFLEAITPFMDRVSYLGNVSVHIKVIECIDSKNNIRSYDYVNPHPTVRVNPHEVRINNTLLPVYALYREAKNAESPFYRFLCYYKILEGIYNHLRPNLFKAATERGARIRTERELVPHYEELRSSHADLVGKPIKDIFDNRFTPAFRNEIAHYFLASGQILNVSHAQALEKFSYELFIVESCARVVISTQERYVEQLSGTGT